MKVICSILLLFFLVQSAKGQELYGKYLDHQQGLLSNECYDISYDENGYLIVGTLYGPVKYNGEKFIPICTNLSMERRMIYDFEKDPYGNVYFLNSKNELFRLQNDQAIWIGPKNLSEFKDPSLRFTRLYYTPEGFYISTYSDFVRFSFKTQKVQHYYTYKGKQTKTEVFKFVYNSKQAFPFSKYYGNSILTDGLGRFDFPESNQRFNLKKTLAHDSREDQVTIGKTTYILISMRLFKKRANHIIPLNFSQILFIEYFQNRIWLCTMNGLIELDKEGNLIHHHFIGDIIGGIVPLKSGGVAISFNRKGVFISSNINNRVHYNFTATTSATINHLNLVANQKGEVYKYQDYKLAKLSSSDPLKTALKRSYQDGIYDVSLFQNKLILSSSFGLSVFSKDFKKIKSIKDQKNAFFGLFIDKENFYLITRISIIKTNWKNLNSLPYPYNSTKIPIPYIKCHARLNDSIVVLGTKIGLIQLNLKTNKFKPFGPLKKETPIASIDVVGKDKLLICTRYDGIYLVSKNKIVTKIKPPCIAIVKALLFHNQIIINGNDGIYINKPAKSGRTVWVKFFSGECEKMFILQKNLIISYNKNIIIKRLADYTLTFRPKIVLNKFQMGDLSMNTFPSLIPPNKSISVDIDILQFDANRLDLFYKLKGTNTISQSIEGTKINFDALKSGDYELKIYPVIDRKIQFSNSKTFRFTIRKTFWESSVFYIITGFLIFSIIFSILLLINLIRKKRSAERSELESKLNEYKLLAVKAQVNPHFLSNGLAAIQALILKGDNDRAAQYLAKFSFLMRKILYYSEAQFISVKQELQLVDAYLELELLRFRNRFKIQKEILLSKNQLIEFQFPSLLLQPILENAIWHGLKFQEKNPELRISFQINQNSELVIEISDNGPGFNSSTKKEEHLSKGNQLITERIDALNKQFKKQVASIKVISSNSGTKVIFTFSPQLYQSNPI